MVSISVFIIYYNSSFLFFKVDGLNLHFLDVD